MPGGKIDNDGRGGGPIEELGAVARIRSVTVSCHSLEGLVQINQSVTTINEGITNGVGLLTVY